MSTSCVQTKSTNSSHQLVNKSSTTTLLGNYWIGYAIFGITSQHIIGRDDKIILMNIFLSLEVPQTGGAAGRWRRRRTSTFEQCGHHHHNIRGEQPTKIKVKLTRWVLMRIGLVVIPSSSLIGRKRRWRRRWTGRHGCACFLCLCGWRLAGGRPRICPSTVNIFSVRRQNIVCYKSLTFDDIHLEKLKYGSFEFHCRWIDRQLNNVTMVTLPPPASIDLFSSNPSTSQSKNQKQHHHERRRRPYPIRQ